MYNNLQKIACVTNVTSSAYDQTRLILQEHAEYIMEQRQNSVRWTPKDYHVYPNQKLSQTTKEYLISEWPELNPSEQYNTAEHCWEAGEQTATSSYYYITPILVAQI